MVKYKILNKKGSVIVSNIYVEGYKSILSLEETEIAIKLVKDTFERKLSEKLNLTRVSAPLFVEPSTGLNDDLNGYEKAVGFKAFQTKASLEIVQSLAKWKRNALKKYGFRGIYTDMNAIRPYEELDNIHSLYVDQWDWEMVISVLDRNKEFLKNVVRRIYKALVETALKVEEKYPSIVHYLPNDIAFISTEKLLSMYPNLSSKERENEIAKKYGAVFLMDIGDKLRNGLPHDGRAADYDDWHLNGDLILWYEPLNIAYEISSMGIRVNKESLLYQLKKKNEEYKLEYKYHQDIINDRLPLTIGGGIGQSRMCLFMLNKVHIGEVHASYWPEEDIEKFKKLNIKLL